MSTSNGRFRSGDPYYRKAVVCLSVLILGSSVFFTGTAQAQGRQGLRGAERDRFQQMVFGPELVMRNQNEIGLTAEQKQQLVVEMQSAQSDLVPLQLEMAELGESLAAVLEPAFVDEVTAVESAARFMQLESDLKLRHLTLVIRIKNLLSAEQQATLRQIRDNRSR